MRNADCEFALKDGVLEFKEPAKKLPSTWVRGIIVNSFTVGPRQQVWKRTVASTIKRVRDGLPWDPRDLYAVTLEFRFHPSNHQNQELDVENYVKPVVDAVAAGLFLEEEKDPSEIETWAFPDSNFRTLLIHRAANPKDKDGEGVRVSVSVRRWRQDRASVRGPGSHSPNGAATVAANPGPREWNSERKSDEDRFVTPRELEHCIKNCGAYRAMGSEAYHTDPACFWGTQIKRKNLRLGFGKDGKLCSHCRLPPSRSPT